MMAKQNAFPIIGQSVATQQLLTSRRNFSDLQLRKWANRLERCESKDSFSEVTVFVAGSFGRREGSKYSDVDLFFVSSKKHNDYPEINIPRIKFFSDVIRINDDLGFPKLSNDGEFLKFLFLDEVLGDLGSPRDDMSNHFTARMLMLLESSSVYGAPVYNKVLTQLVRSYFRDYPHHPKDFRPTFLINDILRFWKTLCLNYEHKRNQKNDSKKVKQKVKNFKLKYSRLMTCFATVSLISSYTKTITPREVLNICGMTPVERLFCLAQKHPGLKSDVAGLLDSYSWFLEQTGKTTEELESDFSDKPKKRPRLLKPMHLGNSSMI